MKLGSIARPVFLPESCAAVSSAGYPVHDVPREALLIDHERRRVRPIVKVPFTGVGFVTTTGACARARRSEATESSAATEKAVARSETRRSAVTAST